MFDFCAWSGWLEERSRELKNEGLETRFSSSPGVGNLPKPKMCLGLVGERSMGLFENWGTGETDYTVMAPASPKAQMVAHRWGDIVTDETFEQVFGEFLAAFRHHDMGVGHP
jgi:hypothetical protein